MATRNKKEAGIVSVHEIPAAVISAVVLAELAQIEADAKTHPDPAARYRIERSAERLRQIATNSMSGETQAELIQAAKQ